MVSAMGTPDGEGKGGFVLLDEEFKVSLTCKGPLISALIDNSFLQSHYECLQYKLSAAKLGNRSYPFVSS